MAANNFTEATSKTLNAADVKTARGAKWYASSVRAVLKSLEYTAELEANRKGAAA